MFCFEHQIKFLVSSSETVVLRVSLCQEGRGISIFPKASFALSRIKMQELRWGQLCKDGETPLGPKSAIRTDHKFHQMKTSALGTVEFPGGKRHLHRGYGAMRTQRTDHSGSNVKIVQRIPLNPLPDTPIYHACFSIFIYNIYFEAFESMLHKSYLFILQSFCVYFLRTGSSLRNHI